VHLYSML